MEIIILFNEKEKLKRNSRPPKPRGGFLRIKHTVSEEKRLFRSFEDKLVFIFIVLGTLEGNIDIKFEKYLIDKFRYGVNRFDIEGSENLPSVNIPPFHDLFDCSSFELLSEIIDDNRYLIYYGPSICPGYFGEDYNPFIKNKSQHIPSIMKFEDRNRIIDGIGVCDRIDLEGGKPYGLVTVKDLNYDFKLKKYVLDLDDYKGLGYKKFIEEDNGLKKVCVGKMEKVAKFWLQDFNLEV